MTLSEYFQKEGYHTLQINGNLWLNPIYGYLRGFDRTIFHNHFSAA